jgi:transcriptional regulator with GAF, ATPase, and Fis domain
MIGDNREFHKTGVEKNEAGTFDRWIDGFCIGQNTVQEAAEYWVDRFSEFATAYLTRRAKRIRRDAEKVERDMEAAKVIKQQSGNLADAARMLGVTPGAFRERVSRSEYLQKITAQARELLL